MVFTMNEVDRGALKQVCIYSAIGELVKEEFGNLESINIENLPAGVYLLVFKPDNDKRLVKEGSEN